MIRAAWVIVAALALAPRAHAQPTDVGAQMATLLREEGLAGATWVLVGPDRAKLPTLSCGTPQPTARWTMETSSVSPERAETIAR